MRPSQILLALVYLVVLGVSYSVLRIGSLPVDSGTLVVETGDTPALMREHLSLATDSYSFRLWLRIFFSDFRLMAGTYRVDHPTTVYDLFDTVLRTSSDSTDVTITILPGWNLYDIDNALRARSLVASGGILAISDADREYLRVRYPFLASVPSMEGFLYPDTYRIRAHASVRDILDTLLGGFVAHVVNRYGWDADSYHHLILASIIEREERNPDEKPIIAGILEKRLSESIALGTDATVCYPYRLTHDLCTPSFIGDHIRDTTPYNVRVKKGLPPTPIANPTETTYNAVLHPESSPYYYYLHDTNGAIHYAKTLAEHNANRVRYLNGR